MNNIRIFLTVIAGMFLLGELSAKARRFRCMLKTSVSEMTIGWEQVSGENPVVYFGQHDEGQNYMNYTYKRYPIRTVNAKGMVNKFACLTNLRPSTVYYFIIQDSEGTSQRYSFKTLPDDHNARLSIIGGGDSRNHRIARQNANKMVAKVRPHLVLFAGDMTGGDSGAEWQRWMDDWQLTIGTDGRMTPVIAARGNHERSDASIIDMFDVPHPKVFYGITLARGLMRIYTLNSMKGSSQEQLKWLTNDLAENQDIAWRMAQYHHPMRPHNRRKHEQEFLRRNWGRLFYTYKVQLALECDSHLSKITWPIRATDNRSEAGYDEGFVRDTNGTVFIGEGGWGAPLRKNDDTKRWTRASGSFNQIKWVLVSRSNLEIRTLKTENVDRVVGLTDENQFDIPENIDLWMIRGKSVVTIKNKQALDFVARPAQQYIQINNPRLIQKERQAELRWAADDKGSFIKYKVQVSQNKLFWKTIAVVPQKLNTAKGTVEYKYTDYTQKKGGKYYYKISAVSTKGKELAYTFLEMRTMGQLSLDHLETEKGKSVAFNLNLYQPTDVLIELFDVNRKLVLTQKLRGLKGTQTIPIDCKTLELGHYLLELSYEGQLIRKSIHIKL